MTEAAPQDVLPPEERARLRTQLRDQAVKLAVSSKWDEAVTVNREYARVFGEEPENLNRLGKALTEMGQVTEARKSYARALELDPTNTIAKRMLDKLANMKDSAAAAQNASQLDVRLFVEETGKAAVANLQALAPGRKAILDAGDVVELRAEGNAVNVHAMDGEYVGMVEPRVGLRLARMMAAGNQYSAALVSVTPGIRVMIRETFQAPSMVGRVSFPQARATDFRGFTRRSLVRQDEGEWTDDEFEEEETEDWSEIDSDIDDQGVDASGDGDDESFD